MSPEHTFCTHHKSLRAHYMHTFFNCYLAFPQTTSGHSQGVSLTNPMLITAFYLFQPKGHRESHSKTGSLRPVKSLAGFEPG